MLRWWHYGFDPMMEGLQFLNIWVLLPDLPLFFWTREDLTTIGDHLGWFIHMDSEMLFRADKRLGQILVEIKMHEGFHEKIVID